MKKHIVLLSLMAFISLPTFATDVVEDYFDMAKNFYRSGDFSQSLEYANQILKTSPTHFGANYLNIILTQPQDSISDLSLDKTINVRPAGVKTGIKQSDEYNFNGEKFYLNKDYQNAKTSFQTAIKHNLRNIYAYNNLGLTYWKLGQYRNAKNVFMKAYRINNTFSAPMINLSQMLINNKEYKLAYQTLNKVIQNNRNDYCAYYLLGILNKEQCKYQQAIKCFNQVTLLSPKFSLAYIQLADVYYLTKDYSWSNSTLEKYIEFNPKDDYAYYMLYRNYLAIKDYHVAKNYIVKAASINNCLNYRLCLSEIEKHLDNICGAVAVLKSINNPNSEVLNELGNCYVELKDYNSALIAYTNAYKGKESRPIYLYNVAKVYQKIGDVTNYKKIIKDIELIKPDTDKDYIDLAYINSDLNNKKSSINIINSGIKKYQKNIELYNTKLNIYIKTSDKEGILRTKREIDRIINK